MEGLTTAMPLILFGVIIVGGIYLLMKFLKKNQ